jgi:Tfp pilus assembly PilM family ATPase
MKSHHANFCGLDLQKDNLSIVQFSGEENAVTLIALQPVSQGPGNDAWQIWQNELSAMKGRLKSFSRDIICGIPSEYAQIKHCMIDDTEKDWREAVEWDMGQQILGPRGDYVIDYELAEAGHAAGVKKYLAVAYRKALVDQTTEMLQSVKLVPRIIDLDVFGLINVFEENYPEKRDDVSLLVHSERTLTKLVLTIDGAFLDFLSFEHSDEETFPNVLEEKIEGFISTAKKIGDGASESIYLSGSFFSPAARRGPILEKIAGSEILDPFKKIACQVAIDAHQLHEYSPQLSVAVGLALHGRE